MSGKDKEAYADFEVDVGASLGTIWVRAVLLVHLAEGTPEGAPRGGARGLGEAVRYAFQDIEDRCASFERRLTEVRSPAGTG